MTPSAPSRALVHSWSVSACSCRASQRSIRADRLCTWKSTSSISSPDERACRGPLAAERLCAAGLVSTRASMTHPTNGATASLRALPQGGWVMVSNRRQAGHDSAATIPTARLSPKPLIPASPPRCPPRSWRAARCPRYARHLTGLVLDARRYLMVYALLWHSRGWHRYVAWDAAGHNCPVSRVQCRRGAPMPHPSSVTVRSWPRQERGTVFPGGAARTPPLPCRFPPRAGTGNL